MTVEQDQAAMFGAKAMAKALRGEPTTQTETLYAARVVCQELMAEIAEHAKADQLVAA